MSVISAPRWIRSHCTLLMDGRGNRPIRPYSYQSAIWKDRSRQRIVLKSRQMGVSQALACEAVYIALNRPGSTILLVSRGLLAARNILRYARQSIGPAIQSGLVARPSVQNTVCMEWDKLESRIVSLSASVDAARSYSATCVYLDEAAYLPHAEEIYQALAPTISTGGRITVVSTPHGRGNLFHRLWTEAEDSSSRWSAHRVHWSLKPDYTPEWAEKERRRHTSRSWAEEYELSFEQSGRSVFQETSIQGLLRPASGREAPFFAGLDLARYEDYTALVVLDVQGRLAGMQRFNQAGWSVQVDRVVRALQEFPGCQLICDATAAGDPVFALIEKQAADSVRTTGGAPLFSVLPFIYTGETRSVLMDELSLAVEQTLIQIPDPAPAPSLSEGIAVLLGEMRAFQWETTLSGRSVPRHPPGGHDDCIQALALAWRSLKLHQERKVRIFPALTAVGRNAGLVW